MTFPKLRYFTSSEFDQHGARGTGEKMNSEFLIKLDNLRHACGFPFHITSGYRSPEYNNRVSSTGFNGPHTTGRAVDINCYGEQAYTLVKLALDYKFTGIGIAQKGGIKTRFIHLDNLEKSDGFNSRPCIWSY